MNLLKPHDRPILVGLLLPITWYSAIFLLSSTRITDDLAGSSIVLYSGAVTALLSSALTLYGIKMFWEYYNRRKRRIDSVRFLIPTLGIATLIFYLIISYIIFLG